MSSSSSFVSSSSSSSVTTQGKMLTTNGVLTTSEKDKILFIPIFIGRDKQCVHVCEYMMFTFSPVYKDMFEEAGTTLAEKWFFQDQVFCSTSVDLFSEYAKSFKEKIFTIMMENDEDNRGQLYDLDTLYDFLQLVKLFKMDKEKMITDMIDHADYTQYSSVEKFITLISGLRLDGIYHELNAFCEKVIKSFSKKIEDCKYVSNVLKEKVETKVKEKVRMVVDNEDTEEPKKDDVEEKDEYS
jgi:hypothetical protein